MTNDGARPTSGRHSSDLRKEFVTSECGCSGNTTGLGEDISTFLVKNKNRQYSASIGKRKLIKLVVTLSADVVARLLVLGKIFINTKDRRECINC